MLNGSGRVRANLVGLRVIVRTLNAVADDEDGAGCLSHHVPGDASQQGVLKIGLTAGTHENEITVPSPCLVKDY